MEEKKYRDELLKKIEKEAHDYERDFHGCSRCVLKPLQDNLNLGDEASLKASTPLAAGVAMRGDLDQSWICCSGCVHNLQDRYPHKTLNNSQ